jgi:hypothetical protein
MMGPAAVAALPECDRYARAVGIGDVNQLYRRNDSSDEDDDALAKCQVFLPEVVRPRYYCVE